MKVKFIMDCGYSGTTEKEIVDVDDNTTEEEIEQLNEEWFWNKFSGGCYYEILRNESEANGD